MKNAEDLKTLYGDMRERIWMRDTGLCKSCSRIVYRSLRPRGHVHHIDTNPKNNKRNNLVLLCASCHSKFHYLYTQDQFKYMWKMELITGMEHTLYGEKPDISYRHHRACVLIDELERENNIFNLHPIDLERLGYLKVLKAQLFLEHKKAEEIEDKGDIK